ncbi:MAG: transglutaminase domain-containing protein, partial [Treponema sp.]|nr:transglutaminase domain-containing protein [Treponema sp.]
CAVLCSAGFAFYENETGKGFFDFISIDTSKIMSLVAPDFPLMDSISGYGTSLNAEEPLYTVSPSQKEILSLRGNPFEAYYLSTKCYSSWDGEKWSSFQDENESRHVEVFFADEKFVPHSNQIELTVRDDFMSVIPLTNLTESVTLPTKYSLSGFYVSDSKSVSVSPGLKKNAVMILRTGNHADPEPDYEAVTSSKVPESIRELSEKLGASVLDEKAYIACVLDYLHGEFKYSLDSPKPPKDMDPYEFFLFTSKTGFCTWYAGSFVLLMQSAGIPCRMVKGYSAVTNGIGRASISGLQMHAWPEVYLDGRWQIFEATAVLDAQNPYLFINQDDSKTRNYISKLLEDSDREELSVESEKKSFDFRFLIYGFAAVSVLSVLVLSIRKIILSKNLSYRAKRIVKIYGRKNIPSPREIGWLQWKKEVSGCSKTEKEIRLSKDAARIADLMIQKLYADSD